MVREPSLIRQLRTATNNPKRSAFYGIGKIQQKFLDFLGIGTNIYEESWDALVILDACRSDVMREVAGGYDFISDFDTRYSRASNSRQFMRRNFKQLYFPEMENTAYISANTFSEEMFSESEFLYLDHVWKYAYDEELGAVPPRPVTDRAIKAGREVEFDHMIVHYMQPHAPLITDPDFNYFDELRSGEISKEEALAAHRENLRMVLEEVQILLKNIDASKVVISADHGESFGEWGIYGHQPHSVHPSLRRIPWIETTASDNHTHQPADYDDQSFDTNVESQLKALGYR